MLQFGNMNSQSTTLSNIILDAAVNGSEVPTKSRTYNQTNQLMAYADDIISPGKKKRKSDYLQQ